MPSDTGFKRVILPKPLKLSTISLNNSTEAEDTPSIDAKNFTFEALKKMIRVEALTESDKETKSLIDTAKTKPKIIEKKAKRRKYNTKKGVSRAIRFIYVYKKGIDVSKDSGALFKELIDLVN